MHHRRIRFRQSGPARVAEAEEYPVLEAEKQAITRLEEEWRHTTNRNISPFHQPEQPASEPADQFHPLTSFNLRTPLKYVTARDIDQYRRLAPQSSALLHTLLSLLGETGRSNELRHVASMIALCSATSPTEHFVIFFRVPSSREPLSAATRRLRTEWWTNAHRNLDAQTTTLRTLITQIPFNDSTVGKMCQISRRRGYDFYAGDILFARRGYDSGLSLAL